MTPEFIDNAVPPVQMAWWVRWLWYLGAADWRWFRQRVGGRWERWWVEPCRASVWHLVWRPGRIRRSWSDTLISPAPVCRWLLAVEDYTPAPPRERPRAPVE